MLRWPLGILCLLTAFMFLVSTSSLCVQSQYANNLGTLMYIAPAVSIASQNNTGKIVVRDYSILPVP